MTKISFVYFDVGGVVIKDYSATKKWLEMQQALGITGKFRPAFEEIWAQYRDQICLDYDIENLVPLLRQKLGLYIPDSYSMVQDFVNRYEPNPTIWPVISTAKKHVRIGLLTNMYPHLLDTIFARQDLKLDQGWDIIVDSSVVKAQKPESKIFQIAEQMSGVKGDQILFIDNQVQHVSAAKLLGWQTYFYDSRDYTKSSQELTAFLEKKL